MIESQNYKRTFAIVIIALLFAISAYSLAQIAQDTANTANNTASNISISINVSSILDNKTYDYFIYKSGNNIYTQNSTGTIISSGTDISNAIEAVALSNKLILISGNYNVARTINIINNSVSLDGNNAQMTLSNNVNNNMFYVTGDYFSIEGFVLDMNGANNAFPALTESAIYLDNSNKSRIVNNNISSDWYPAGDDGNTVFVNYTSFDTLINGNILTGGRNNIFAYNNNIVTNNVMSGGSHTCGYFRVGFYNTITGNICESASGGFTIEGLTTTNITDSHNNIVSNNVLINFSGGSGVTLIKSTDNVVSSNTCDQIQFDCIRIDSSSNNNIIGNNANHISKTSSSNQSSIYLTNSSSTIYSQNNTISTNVLYGDPTKAAGQEFGIFIVNPAVNTDNKIYYNTVIYSRFADYSGITTGNQAYIYYNGTCFVSSDLSGQCSISNPSIQINESQVINLSTDLSSKVNKSGDNMTGNLSVYANVFISYPNYPPLRVERNTSLTSGLFSTLALRANTTADMVNDFGTGLGMEIMDSSGISNVASSLRTLRDGNDGSGRYEFWTNNSGTMNLGMTIKPDGRIRIGGSDTDSKLYVEHNDYPVQRIKRYVGGSTTGASGTTAVQIKTAGSAQNGFGAQLFFEMTDAENSDSILGGIAGIRNGADNTGSIVLKPRNAGTEVSTLTADNTGNITISGLAGTGTVAICVDSTGKIVRSTNATSNYLTC